MTNENPPEKSIGLIESFALIANNISGPAMMGLPQLFREAGIIPVIICTILVCIGSSLSATFLADSISSIPGNNKFNEIVDFSTAFRVIAGENWYVISETLFLTSCMVQACAALVETAQSLDNFIATILFGRTYAIELYPYLVFTEWKPSLCENDSRECVPFNKSGPLIVTLGFVITTCVFLPLGRGHLKETMTMQLIAFASLIVLMSQFYTEFFVSGLEGRANLPLIGKDLSHLTGVILFNFAFSITIPSWLNEKTEKVSVNQVVWSSTIFSCLLYISFGLLGAMAYKESGGNLLVVLSSNQVSIVTRVCAALFSVFIIGCGVPVYCVIIHTSLYNTGVINDKAAMFCGTILPYIISSTLYQGSTLMQVLSWSGLIVNGLVAFLLPLLLALYTIDKRKKYKDRYTILTTSIKLDSESDYKIDNKIDDIIDNKLHDTMDNKSNRIINNKIVKEIEMSDRSRWISSSQDSYMDVELDENIDSKSIDKSDSKLDNNSTRQTDKQLDKQIDTFEDEFDSLIPTQLSPNHTKHKFPVIDLNIDLNKDITIDRSKYLRILSDLSVSHVSPLPKYIESYSKVVLYCMLFGFIVSIISTIVIDIVHGISR